MSATVHRWVRIPEALSYLQAGWMALPTLVDTPHGRWSVHMAWLCDCAPATPAVHLEGKGRAG